MADSHWAAIEQALERIENGEGLADDVNILPLLPALQAAWKAVGEAKRRESELNQERVSERGRHAKIEYDLQARVAELERALAEIESKPYRAEEVIARLRARREATGE